MKLFSLAAFIFCLLSTAAYPTRQESKDCEVLLHLRVASVCNVETVLKTEALSRRLCMYMHNIPTDDAWVKGEFCPPPAVEEDEDDSEEEVGAESKSTAATATAASTVSAVSATTATE